MPLIELVGPPGVGKSTLVGAAVDRGPGVLEARRAVLDPRLPLPRGAVDRLRASRPGVLRTLSDRVLTGPGEAEVETALATVAPHWQPFLRMVLDGGAGTSRPHDTTPAEDVIALMERDWFHGALRTRALLERERTRADLLLLDEGLTHPFKARAIVGRGDLERLERYGRLVPLPDVLVVLDAPGSVVAERLLRRHRAAPRRARWASLGGDLSAPRLAEEVEALRQDVEVIAAAAAGRGCPVVRIESGTLPPEELAGRMMAALPQRRAGIGADAGDTTC